jgi:hypothetical protein
MMPRRGAWVRGLWGWVGPVPVTFEGRVVAATADRWICRDRSGLYLLFAAPFAWWQHADGPPGGTGALD